MTHTIRLFPTLSSSLLLIGTLLAQPHLLHDDPLPAAPGQLLQLDIDGDADPDFLNASGSVWFRNDGGAWFEELDAEGLFAGGLSGQFLVAAGDIEGDGDGDLVSCSTPWSAISPSQSRLWINGGGSFTAVVGPSLVIALYLAPLVMDGALADLDSDGDLDVVLATAISAPPGFGGPISPGPTLVWRYDGNGVLTPIVGAVPATFGPRSIEVADVDGNGTLDIIDTRATYWGQLLWISGIGGLNFVSTTLLALPTTVSSDVVMMVADLNGDGRVDLLGRNTIGLGPLDIWVVLGNPTGGFGASFTRSVPRLLDVSAIDITGDLRREIVVMTDAGLHIALLEDTTGIQPLSPPSFVFGASPVVSDLDQDGDEDLVLTTSRGRRVLLNAAGALNPIDTSFSARGGSAIQLGDMDNDGDIDCVTAYNPSPTPRIDVAWNDGRGRLSHQGDLNCGGGCAGLNIGFLDLALLDGNGDQLLDIYVGSSNGDYLLQSPMSSWSALPAVPGIGVTRQVEAGDLDGDGDRDVLLHRQTWFNTDAVDSIQVAFLTGVSTFAGPITVFRSDYITDLKLADLDLDGDLDVVLSQFGNPPLGIVQGAVVLQNPGNGFLQFVANLPVDSGFVDVGDFNLDGLPDLLLDHQVWTQQGTLNFLPGAVVAPPPFPLGTFYFNIQPTLAIELNGDGYIDVVDLQGNTYLNLGSAGFGPAVPFSQPNYWQGRFRKADLDADGDVDVVSNNAWVFLNACRHLERQSLARPGQALRMGLHGSPNEGATLFASTIPASISLGSFGTLHLDPTNLLPIHTTSLDSAGKATFNISLPVSSPLVGTTFHFQALLGSRTSNAFSLLYSGF